MSIGTCVPKNAKMKTYFPNNDKSTPVESKKIPYKRQKGEMNFVSHN